MQEFNPAIVPKEVWWLIAKELNASDIARLLQVCRTLRNNKMIYKLLYPDQWDKWIEQPKEYFVEAPNQELAEAARIILQRCAKIAQVASDEGRESAIIKIYQKLLGYFPLSGILLRNGERGELAIQRLVRHNVADDSTFGDNAARLFFDAVCRCLEEAVVSGRPTLSVPEAIAREKSFNRKVGYASRAGLLYLALVFPVIIPVTSYLTQSVPLISLEIVSIAAASLVMRPRDFKRNNLVQRWKHASFWRYVDSKKDSGSDALKDLALHKPPAFTCGQIFTFTCVSIGIAVGIVMTYAVLNGYLDPPSVQQRRRLSR